MLQPPSRHSTQASPPAPPANYIPGVRYTTGAVTVSGWEQTLTTNDPNLKHWNWSAMTSYTQSCYGKVPAGAYMNKKRPSGGIYVKPVHVNPETYAQKRLPYPPINYNANNHSAANVNGNVRFAKPSSGSAAVAKSYSGNYTNTNVGGQIVAGSGNASRDVYGKLVSRTQ